MGDLMIRCAAMKFKSGSNDFYLCLIKAKELLAESTTDAYDTEENKDGYQRKIQKNRAKKFSEYLHGCKGSFSGTILLNVRDKEKCNFVSETHTGFGQLEIDDTVYIVDGQHRVAGLELAIDKGYDKNILVPAMITVGNNKNHEALTFLIVNRTAKGIKADLTDELIYKTIPAELLNEKLRLVLNLSTRKEIGEFCIDMTKNINETIGSVWCSRIAMPEEKMLEPRIVNQRTFALSFEQAIKTCGTLKRAFNVGEIEQAQGWLHDYWQAVSQKCPEATGVNARDYVLMKSVGVQVINRLFARVLDEVGKDPKIADFKKSLDKMELLCDAQWKSGHGFSSWGTNKAAIDKIYDALEEEFDTNS